MFSMLADRLDGLRRRYAEPHRRYHNQAHVDAMLRGLAQLKGVVTNQAAAELAVWYHDAIYDPAATDNEAKSAQLMRLDLAGLADPACLAVADAMVLATAGHVLPADLSGPLRGDVAAFLDLDLAVLGAAPDEYNAYEAGIALEYIPVHGEAAYRRGRTAFLRGTLARRRLFLTDRAHQALDGQARKNLRRAVTG